MTSPLKWHDRSGIALQSEPFQWRESPWIANVWLAFLLFPLVTFLLSDLATVRKVVGTGLIVMFGIVHMLGFRAAAAREFRMVKRPTGTSAIWHPDGAWVYIIAMALVAGALTAVTGWPAFGVFPFLIAFAMFNFSWRTSIMLSAAVLAVSVLAPLLWGEIGELWFFSLIVISVGAGAAFSRMAEETHIDRAQLATDLALSEQRSEVARDVHDVLGHSLTAVILKAQVCQKLLSRVEPADEANRLLLEQCHSELAELDAVSRGAMAEIRSTVGGLRAARLSDELIAARTVLADAGAELTVHGDQARVPEQYRTTLAWVVRESVTNIVRHARAEACIVEFGSGGQDPLMRIRDDGVGIGASGEGNGLRGMRERVEAVGASLHVDATSGTVIEVRA